jgi:hypothetical protein
LAFVHSHPIQNNIKPRTSLAFPYRPSPNPCHPDPVIEIIEPMFGLKLLFILRETKWKVSMFALLALEEAVAEQSIPALAPRSLMHNEQIGMAL